MTKQTLKIAPPGVRPNKYHGIAQIIKDRILAKKITHKLPNIAEMAEEFSVTPVTMQKALNLLKEDGCVIAIPGKGSFVTRLQRPRTHTIAAIISSSGPLGLDLANGIQDSCSTQGQSALVENYGYRKRLCLTRLQRIAEREQVDGFIIWPDAIKESIEDIIDYLIDTKIPYVLAPLIEFKQFTTSTTVTNIDVEPTADLMTHLIGTGNKRIGYVTSTDLQTSDYSLARENQYHRSLSVSGLPSQKRIVIDTTAGSQISNKIVQQLKKLDAVFCVTDRTAMTLSKICLRNRIGIPDDLVVAGFGNSEFARLTDMTSIEQNFRKIGSRAVELLLEEIEGKRTKPAHEVIGSELIIRQSSLRTSA